MAAPEPGEKQNLSVSVIETRGTTMTVDGEIDGDIDGDSPPMTVGATNQSTVSSSHVVETVETASKTRKRIIHELHDVTFEDFESVDLQFYFGYISDSRLIHMPARGSDWDRVLTAAEYFGMQLDDFATRVSDFVQDSYFVRDTALASCYFLLQLGYEQAEALEPTFNALYALGILLARTIRLKDFFFSPAVMNDVGGLFSSLVELVGDIAVFYRKQVLCISGGTGDQSDYVNVDFDAKYGSRITEIWDKRQRLVNHMWSHELGDRRDLPLDIAVLRRKLSTANESIKAQVYGRVAEKKERVEGTCEWIQRDLSEFVTGKQQIFTITGSGGCGKSFLASWMRERLEKHVNLRRFETLSFTFAEDNAAGSTTVAFLKSLLSQLLDQSIGDVPFFEKLSRIFAEKGVNDRDEKKLESRLWEALDIALSTRAKDKSKYPRLIVIVDGLDEAVGGHDAVRELHNKIYQMVDKHIRIRAITFSRPISHVRLPSGRHLVITPEHLRDDIELYLEDRLSKLPAYKKQSEQDQKTLLTCLVARAKGSLLFAYLAVEYLRSGISFSEYQKTIQGIRGDGTTEILEKLFGTLKLKDNDMSCLFAYVLAAERRLTLGELSDLLRVNVPNRTVSDSFNAHNLILNTRGLIVEQKGSARFKNSLIRGHIIKHLCGSSLMSLKESHTCLVMTLLLFSKRLLNNRQEPSLDEADGNVVQSTVGSYHIIDYFLHYWVTHFKSSTLVGRDGRPVIPADMKEIFPDTSFIPLLEWACWQNLFGIDQSISMLDLTLQIRSACFGQKHRSVLQNLVSLGSLQRSSSHIIEAAECFYKASSIGRTVLHKFSPFVISCANSFLVLSDKIQFTERTTLVTQREETIRFIIEVSKRQYGAHSDAVTQWLEVLAKLYVQIRETHRASAVYKELREILVIRFGPNSQQARDVVKEMVGMSVTLKKDVVGADIEQTDETFFELTEEVEYGSEHYFGVIIQRIEYYERIRNFSFAESLYLTLWRRVCETCHSKRTEELQLIKLDIALRYIQFLQQLGRNEEACNIVICVWAEYEHHNSDSKALVIRLKQLATLARSFGMLTVSISILNGVLLWFKDHNRIDDEENISTTVMITEVVEETTQTVVEKRTTTTVTESLTREVWEINYTRCRGGKANDHFFKTSLLLVNLYLEHRKWQEAEAVTRQTLEIIWKSVLTEDIKLRLEQDFIKERLELASLLARCLHEQGRLDKAEEIYVRVFRACLLSLHPDDVILGNVVVTLTGFYEKYHRYEKVMGVYNELLKHYRKHLTVGHSFTVNALYKLASVYMLLGRKEAYDCYIEIVSLFIKDGYCHREGLDAAVNVLNFYHDEHRWAELQKLGAVLWETFTRHHHEWTFSEQVVQTIYERYLYVLEYHAKTEFAVLYRLTVEYRETVTKIYGDESLILVAALTSLAELCERSEEHQDEAITLYEEIIAKTRAVTIETDTRVTTIKKRLSKLYVTVIKSGKSTAKVSTNRALQVCLEVYEKLKIDLGWWHDITLMQLKEIVLVYKGLGTRESTANIGRLLQGSVVEIITRVTEPWALYTAAQTLASIYAACGMVRQGQDLLQQLHVLLLFPNFESVAIGEGKETTIKVDTKVTRASFIFLIVFEQSLNNQSGKRAEFEFSQLMADVLLETLLYEQYVAVITTFTEATRTELLLERAARLRSVWFARGRAGAVAALDKKLLPIFKARYAQQLGVHADNADAVFSFYDALLSEIGNGAAADQTKVDFSLATAKASLAVVRRLMVEEKSPDLIRANAVAKCAFQFANRQHFYHDRSCIVYSYRLAELLAGVGVPAWKTTDRTVKEALLSTSRDIIQTILAALRETGIELVSLRFEDLTALIKLLGEQKNYEELELFLASLWQSREVQRNWSPEVVLRIGTLLVHAYFLASHPERAISLCHTIYYNLRRSHGGLDPQALEFADRLVALLRLSGRRRDAIRVHEDVVSDLDEHIVALRSANFARNNGGSGEAPDERDDRLRAAADTHLDGLRRCGWATRGEGRAAMSELYRRLQKYGTLNVQPIEQWGPASEEEEKKAKDVPFEPLSTWILTGADKDKDARSRKHRDSVTPAKERWGCWDVPRQVPAQVQVAR